MLEIHFANRFETLAELLVRRLGSGAGSAFDEDQVIVPSAAIRRHLTLVLASRHGICANVRFGYLARWLWQQIARVVPGVADDSPFDAATLAWRVYAAFGDPDWVQPHLRLSSYLQRSDPVMRFDLAVQVAVLIDQYVTYRADWLAAWSRGELVALLDQGDQRDQDWQAALWRRLTGEVGAEERDPAAAFVQALRPRASDDRGLRELPRCAHVFCLPTMPPLHLGLLQALGQKIELHLYALNPCQEYWFEVVDRRRLAWLSARRGAVHHEEGHRLLAAWGRQAQSQLSLLVDATGEDAVDDAHFEANPGDHLLARLQNSILEMIDLAPGSVSLDEADRSVEVHVCHSLTREIEVLHDRLLGLFASRDALAPGEVLVVTPGLDAAAPLIDAVFGTAPQDRFIPYAITGMARSEVNPAARVLLDLLGLAGSRLEISAVFGLLQQPLVARAFDLGADDLEQVRSWLQAAGVHWALDAAHRGSLGLPAVSRHSLADGLDRLFLGYALPARIATPFDGRLPAGNAEGTQALALGALWRFVDALGTLRQRASIAQPAASWHGLLVDALEQFASPSDGELDEVQEVRVALDELAEQWRRSELVDALPLEVVRAALERSLDEAQRGGVPTGVVTFSAMSSLRNIPFRVVCAIGLDDGKFPSGARAAEFDLMAMRPRPGDRQRRVDERNLFLDLLLAARDCVHISHAGRSVRDNSPRSASVLVSELLEVLVPAIARDPQASDELRRARSRLVVEHPLQPFSETAFRIDADPRLRSFQRDYADALKLGLGPLATPLPTLAALSNGASEQDDDASNDSDDAVVEPAAPFFAAPLPEPGEEWREVPLDRLIRFFRNPCRTLLERRLGIELRRGEDELLDDEPFVADVPARSALARRLLPSLLGGADLSAARELALAGTEIPVGAFGRRLLDRELTALHDYATTLAAALREPCLEPHRVSLAIAIDGQPWRVHAGFADLRLTGLIRYSDDELRPRDYLAAWLHHLMLCASPAPGAEQTTRWWGRNGCARFRRCEDPLAVLETLLRLYRRGLREPLYFFPKSAWSYVDKGDSAYMAAQTWRVTRYRPHAEGADAAYRLALRGLPDPLGAGFDQFDACAHAVFDPLRDALESRPS